MSSEFSFTIFQLFSLLLLLINTRPSIFFAYLLHQLYEELHHLANVICPIDHVFKHAMGPPSPKDWYLKNKTFLNKNFEKKETAYFILPPIYRTKPSEHAFRSAVEACPSVEREQLSFLLKATTTHTRAHPQTTRKNASDAQPLLQCHALE